ncbi:MAG: hypothetical protein J0L91_03350 [Burkholderiales bacterium]|nr:hypothetical protein [Burkholderiales bacterium]
MSTTVDALVAALAPAIRSGRKLAPGMLDALAVSTVSVPLALVFTALAPLLRLWQRRVAAT